jgi:3-ketoacyl-CoA synthase
MIHVQRVPGHLSLLSFTPLPAVVHTTCAGEALKANITTLGPLVLPVSEQLLFASNMIVRKTLGKKAARPYVPDFTTAFDHICIHTGGRGVIDEIEKHLQLHAGLIEPSRAALFR